MKLALQKKIFHIIANAHLDPVWFWDMKEGLNEGIVTCKAILDLMDQYPMLKFTRGEASIYKHIEENEPEVFERIKTYFKQGRWEIAGGHVVQGDTNLQDTFTFVKQYEIGMAYFKEKFDFTPEVAWAADSFGHSAGMPEIYANAGFKYFCYWRPTTTPIAKAAFYWESMAGKKILSFRIPVGWYGSQRNEIQERLDSTLEKFDSFGLENMMVTFGLGNHGGGSSVRQIEDILSWQKTHKEVEIRFSTMREYFSALEAEIAQNGGESYLPKLQGELNYCLRGCYSSMARFKYAFRKAESEIKTTELCSLIIDNFTGLSPKDTSEAYWWYLFNTFHDILPGSSIERAFQQQLDQLAGCVDDFRQRQNRSIWKLTQSIDTQVKEVAWDMPKAVPIVWFNPLPYPVNAIVESETQLDYRHLINYTDRVSEVPVEVLDEKFEPLPFQVIQCEHSSIENVPWRIRVVMPLTIPAMGWRKISVGYQENPESANFNSKIKTEQHSSCYKISNDFYSVEACPGNFGLQIKDKDGKNILDGKQIEFARYNDPWGSWGGMSEEYDSIHLTELIEKFMITSRSFLK